MARFQLVKCDDAPFAPKWTIEEVIPGEKPIPLPFMGTRTEAEAELSRLNLYGKNGGLTPPHPRDQDPHHTTLITEWRDHHGDTWVRADALHPAIRRMIDPQDRTAAIRQRLRQLLASCPELEAKTVGNAARSVAFYRVTETKKAGLEG